MRQICSTTREDRRSRIPEVSDAHILIAAVEGLPEALYAGGVDPHRMLRAAGFDSKVVRLDLKRYCALFELAADQTGNDTFGLQFGRDCAPERLGLLGEIVLASPTLGAALDNLARLFAYHQQNTDAVFRRAGDVWRLEYRILDGRILQRRQNAELTLGALLNLLRRCLGPSWIPDEVHFEHPQPDDIRMHRRVFGAPIYFSMETNALVCPDPGLSRPMPGADPARMTGLRDRLIRLAGGTGTLSLTDQVAGEIRSRLPSGYPHIEDVADALRMTRWTLQRRLMEQGQVFSDLVETTRRRLAELHLGAAHMPIRDIADVLGYSELSAFTRACVRWFDEPPSRVRERIRSAA